VSEGSLIVFGALGTAEGKQRWAIQSVKSLAVVAIGRGVRVTVQDEDLSQLSAIVPPNSTENNENLFPRLCIVGVLKEFSRYADRERVVV
jgi:hypothetical protein